MGVDGARRSRRGAAGAAACAVVLVLPCGAASAQVVFEGAAGNIARRVTTLRIPASGSLTLTSGTGGLVTVGVAISGLGHTVRNVIWFLDRSQGSQALVQRSFRDATDGTTGCRTELFAGPIVLPGPGHAVVTLEPEPGSLGDPSVSGALMQFRNVAGTSINGACCSNVSISGTGFATISKTITGAGLLDMVIDAVCIAWSGPDPGVPTPDVATNQRLVPRVVQSSGGDPTLYGLAATAVANPSGGGNTMRWLQTGQRDWATTGLMLVGQVGPQPDAGVPPVDAMNGPGPDGAGGAEGPAQVDGAPVGVTADAMSGAADGPGIAADAAGADGQGVAADGAVVDVSASPNDAAGPPDGGADAGLDPGMAVAPVDLQVGCACGLGGRPGGGSTLVGLALATLLAWLRRRRLRTAKAVRG